MKKASIGRIICSIGILILSIGLICNGFELVSVAVFRIIVLAGIIAEIAALVFALKRNEF